MALNGVLIENLKEVVRLQYQSKGLENSIAELNEKIQFSYKDYLPETVDRKVIEDEFLSKAKKENKDALFGRIMIIILLLFISGGSYALFIITNLFGLFAVIAFIGVISIMILIANTKEKSEERIKSAANKAEQKVQGIERYNLHFNSELKSAKQNVERNKEKVNQNAQEVDLIYQKVSSLCAQIGLHPAYQEINTVQKILSYLEKGRAETLREAINLYEDEKARTIFQNQQLFIEQQRLDEVQKQTSIAKEQAYYLKQQAQAQAQAANRVAQAAERNARAAETNAIASQRSARANERAADDIREMNNRDYWRN